MNNQSVQTFFFQTKKQMRVLHVYTNFVHIFFRATHNYFGPRHSFKIFRAIVFGFHLIHTTKISPKKTPALKIVLDIMQKYIFTC